MKLLNTVETYQSLQPFNSLEALNANTQAIREQFGNQLTPSTLNVLDALARYSSKYYGLSYRSKSKIAEELGVTRRTVIRSCNHLEKLGIIRQYELKRHNGDRRQSSNAIIFIPLIPTKKEDVTPTCHTKETLLDTTNTKPRITSDTLKRGLRDKIPAYIYDLLSPYLNESDLFKMYSTLLRAKASVDRSIIFELNESLFSDSIMSVIHSYKRGKVRSLFAVMYTAIQDTSAQIYRKENYNIPDWLNLATH